MPVPALCLLLENVPLNGTVWEYTRECGALGKHENILNYNNNKNIRRRTLAENWMSGSGENLGVFVRF